MSLTQTMPSVVGDYPVRSTPIQDHWSEIARKWELVGSPLRPVSEDLAAYTEAISRPTTNGGVFRALILGVTPELYRLPWRTNTVVTAVDHTQAMIDALWPGPSGSALCADWTDIPLAAASCDVILCDGGLTVMKYPDAHRELVTGLRRLLTPGGRCIIRLFIPPTRPESPDSVLAELLSGEISNLNVLKLRLGMAMQSAVERGVKLADIWDALHRVAPNLSQLAHRIGWQLDHLLAINTYRDCPQRYHFSSVEEVSSIFCNAPGGFACESIHAPNYHLGERCPLVVFRREG